VVAQPRITAEGKAQADSKAQHIDGYVSVCKSRTTKDHGLRRSFSTPC